MTIEIDQLGVLTVTNHSNGVTTPLQGCHLIQMKN